MSYIAQDCLEHFTIDGMDFKEDTSIQQSCSHYYEVVEIGAGQFDDSRIKDIDFKSISNHHQSLLLVSEYNVEHQTHSSKHESHTGQD